MPSNAFTRPDISAESTTESGQATMAWQCVRLDELCRLLPAEGKLTKGQSLKAAARSIWGRQSKSFEQYSPSERFQCTCECVARVIQHHPLHAPHSTRGVLPHEEPLTSAARVTQFCIDITLTFHNHPVGIQRVVVKGRFQLEWGPACEVFN